MKKIFLTSLLISVFPVAYAQNVGIGTNTPVAKLQVAGNVAIDSGLQINARNLRVPFVVEGSPVNQFLDQQSLQYNTYSIPASNPAWQSFTAEVSGTLVQLYLHFGGNNVLGRFVRIYSGTGTQGALLQTVTMGTGLGWTLVNGLSVPLIAGQTYTIWLGQEGAWSYATSDVYSGGISSKDNLFDYAFKTLMNNVNDQILRISNNGNVGVGLSVPEERLDVRGNIKASGNLDISGTIINPERLPMFLLNGWTNYGETYGNATFYKDKQSVVRLSGLVKNGGSPVITQLSPSLRPATDLIFTVVSGTGFARLDIKTNGNVQLMGSYSNLYVSLDGIAFRVD